MTQPILYLAITNHGFGHATRMASIANTIQRLCPDVLLILATTAPRWLLASYIEGDFIHRPVAYDVGVVQGDSLTMDKAATLEKLQDIRAKQDRIVANEVNFLQQNRVGLVLGDIPPLASVMARAAGIPGWMISNFGWDFIYRSWGEEFFPIADWIAECFGQCDRLFRLPFHESMAAFPQITDVGLTGGSPRFSRDELRASLYGDERAGDQRAIAPPERTVMLTFGGLGLDQIPYQNLDRFPDWQFISFDANAPDLPNLMKLGKSRYRPVDLMPLCGRVLSKPGYSTFSEACRLGTPLVSITRTDFAEAELLLQGIQAVVPHQILSPDVFFNGNWDFLRDPLRLPQAAVGESIDRDGNAAIAQAVLNFFHRA
jgi:hypothetical protein